MINRQKQSVALAALCIGFFMVIMDVTIVNVALPSILSSLQANVSELQWVVAGYTLTFASLLIFSGHLSDQVGAKHVLTIGLILFTISSSACALAPSISLLILFRLVQGATAATLVPSSLALINSIYSDPKSQAKAIGVWAAVGGIAAASGPILGAFLTAGFGWRAVFFVNVPTGFVAIALVVRYISQTTPKKNVYFDIAGQASAILICASLAFTLIEVGSHPLLSSTIIVSSLLFIASLIAFIIIEYHSEQAMFPLQFFKSKNFSIAIVIGMLINAGIYGELFILPLYFQEIKGYNVIQTGFAIFPMLALIAIASFLSGKTTSRIGTKPPMLIGLAVGALGFFILFAIISHTINYYWLILPLSAMGFGIAFTMLAATILAINSTPENRAGLASGAFNTSRQLGSLIGVTSFGTILSVSKHFIHGMQITLFIACLLFTIGFLLALCIKT